MNRSSTELHSTGFVQSDLRFLLPIEGEQQVAVVGEAPELSRAIAAQGATVVGARKVGSISRGRRPPGGTLHGIAGESELEPLGTATLDHVLVPITVFPYPPWLVSELGRVLKPGGWLFLGTRASVRTPWSFPPEQPRRSPRARLLGAQPSLRTISRSLLAGGLRVVRWYGIYTRLEKPKFIVPLEGNEASSYFFRHLMVSATPSSRATRRLGIICTWLGQPRLAFPDHGVVARRGR